MRQPHWVPLAQGLYEVTAKLLAGDANSDGGLPGGGGWGDCSQAPSRGCPSVLTSQQLVI